MKIENSSRTSAAIFIAMPVFNGAKYLRDTLDSIRAQTFKDYRVLISIDGGDDRSAAACADYAGDPRLEVVCQPGRLGFKGNLNWLIGRAAGRYFCYWQQDDLADADYLQVLHHWAESHPSAACVYSDIQWFGLRSGREEHPSIRGAARERVLQAMNGYHWAAIRGLVRGDALRRAGPWPEIPFNGDFLWVVKLAGAGELHRVPGTLYYKRAHPGSASAGSHARLVDPTRWRDLVVFARHLFDLLEPRMSSGVGRWRRMCYVVARLLAPQSMPLFAISGFTDSARSRLLLELADELASRGRAGAEIDPALFDDDESAVDRDLRVLMQWLRARQRVLGDPTSNPLTLGLGATDGNEWLLRDGWSELEPWGVWSTGDACRISVPIPSRMKFARVTLRLSGYVPKGGAGRQVFVQIGDAEALRLQFDSGAVQQFGADVPPPQSAASRSIEIRFRTPGSVSPIEAGDGGDVRKLGVGLHSVHVAPAN